MKSDKVLLLELFEMLEEAEKRDMEKKKKQQNIDKSKTYNPFAEDSIRDMIDTKKLSELEQKRKEAKEKKEALDKLLDKGVAAINAYYCKVMPEWNRYLSKEDAQDLLRFMILEMKEALPIILKGF